MFILKLICCVGGTVMIAGWVSAFMSWLEKKPIILDNSGPIFYITKTYKEIKK